MPEPLDVQLFDAAINHGAGRAKKMLQRVLGVDEDGVIGKGTMRALHEEVIASSAEVIAQAYLDERARFFRRIVEKDVSQTAFLKGWMRRVDHMRELA
jgi:lysozyme family protein